MFFLLSLLWFIRTSKAILFYLYLWQLKEYHIGRFLDHFRTKKGKKIIINQLLFIKLFLISGLFFYFQIFFLILILLYFLETISIFKHFFQKTLKTPIFTKKILFLLFCSFCLVFLILYGNWQKNLFNFTLFLLICDILGLGIFSGIVLVFQPVVAILRRKVIYLAKKKRAKFKDFLVIGITGSYGKTSTKEFLATILEEKYKVLKTKEHQNSEVGISQCILNDLKPEHEIFVCEMGAYNRGGIKLLCDIAKPKIGVLTGINEQHMATFGSQENIIKTKFELIESLPENGLAIFNGNNKYCRELYQETKTPKILCNIFQAIAENMLQADIRAEDIKVEKEQISFKVFSKEGEGEEFKLNLLGAQNVENILLAVCCAKEMGMSLTEISQACQKIKPLSHQMELKKTTKGLNIIDSTYSANPDGVISHLDYLKIWEGRKIIVMPCLIELGSASKEVHKKIGRKIGEVCDLVIISTKEKFKEIKEGAIEKGVKEENILFIENPKKIFENIKSFCLPPEASTKGDKTGNIILLESRIPAQLTNLLMN